MTGAAPAARGGLSYLNPANDAQAARDRFLEVLQAIVREPGDKMLLEAAASSWVKAERETARAA